MLEFSLRQERIKYAKLAQGNNFDVGSTDIIGQVLQKANLNSTMYEKVAKRRAKAQRPLLLKFLTEIGYDDIFNVDEVNEIKALYDKAQEEMKENFKNEGLENDQANYVQQLENKILKQNEDEQKDVKEVVDGQAEGAAAGVEAADGEEEQAVAASAKLTLKFNIRGHFDQVRSQHYIKSLQTLATSSDDCQIKLWNFSNIQRQFEARNGFLEPLMTLRGHSAPVLTITGSEL